ncbi:bifunctional hydroxymethylpyrimidine kinase/phosphomethylpyrimidine kinase [Shimia abyssi]|uniref:bifunctional hydroxymethylpyrimidine kinase/phosphomethylpyrimidine kinase n=1 Tax=Shimia abyssi TaxID=1662395 RepID=UPI000D0E015F|nr:bifunctional hydroxymethylpyrimidine kinase/phosphomethylpyrimidine kinase [Shimia abyssi]
MLAIALTIAGSDSGGGAGIQADLKAFSAMGVYGCSVVTAVTAQNTRDVTMVHAIPDDVVAGQIAAILDDIAVDAIKIGMLGSPSLIETVAHSLRNFDGPVVLDPVMIAKSGVALLADHSVGALKKHLLPRATLVTPNLPEATKLVGNGEALDQSDRLLSLGSKAVLMKGGHANEEICTDWLSSADYSVQLAAPRIDTTNTHGTGCSYSSAITAGLSKGWSLPYATRVAHGWLHQAILRADELNVGQGHGPVHHFHGMWA